MNETNAKEATQCLMGFFEDMKQWELEMIEYFKFFDEGNVSEEEDIVQSKQQKEALAEIYEKYCEVGRKAKRLQDQGLSFNPDYPEHGKDAESVTSITEKPSKVIIETKQEIGLRWRYRYELIQVEGEWKVRDNRKRSSDEEYPKWSKDML